MRVLLRSATALAAALATGLVAAPRADAAQVSTRRTRTVLAVERVKDAVVHISTEQLVHTRTHDALDDAFDRFYKEQDDGDREDMYKPLGSATIIDPSGFLITSYRVVSRGSRLHVSLDQGKDFVARVVGTDPDSDIAILKIDGAQFPFAVMGTSDDLMIGESAIALGNPFAQSRTAAVGVVSALARTVRVEGRTYHDLIQTDAAIDPGNAGGPLVNGDGEIMGVTTAIGGEGRVGLAVPIERAKRIALDLIKNGEAPQAFLGFDVQTVTEDIARSLNVQAKRGASIVALEPKSPAEFAGLKVGDVISSVQKQPVRDAAELLYFLRDVGVGKPAVLEVNRGQEKRTVTVVAAEFPLDRAEALFARKLGAAVTEVSGSSARRMEMSNESGVAVRVVTRGSPAERAGLAPGDVIRAVNSLEISKLSDFRVAVARARKSGSAVLLVQRGFQLEQVPFDFY
jgi:serine protease Do